MFGHPAIAWIAIAPLLVAIHGRSSSRAFLLGLVTGIVYFTGTLYWIATVMSLHGGLARWVAVLINAALVLFLALFPATFALVTRRLVSRLGVRALMAAPLVWVATELARTHVLTGFPWVLLGYSQVTVLPVAQLASVLGVYGVSALVASVSAVAALMALAGKPSEWRPAAIGIGVVLLGVVLLGAQRVSRAEWTRAGAPVRVGLVQGNVDQAEKWDAGRAAGIFDDHLALSREAIADGAELIIWPESSMPFRYDESGASSERVRLLARGSRVPFLIGSNEIGQGTPTQYYNAAFLVQPDGATGGVYRKMHLVPFGEYVPLRRVLFFAAPLVQAVAGFSAGDTAAVLPVDGHAISTAICYEVVYPGLVRQFVRNGSELLTTITNDAWFGRSSAPHQHFAQASMRAIENGRYLVRAANTGISGAVDPYGRVLAESALFERAALAVDARYLRGVTWYARFGDWFVWLSVMAVAGLLLVSGRRVQ